jgi:hypothetical protein
MTNELFGKILTVGLNSQVSQQTALSKQVLNDNAQISVNQLCALDAINNLYKSYYINGIYPTDYVTFQGLNSQHDTSGVCGSNETGTAGNGSIKENMYGLMIRLSVTIF